MNLQRIFESNAGENASVSVIITLFNYEDYIVETLKSVLKQTLRPLDLVIVDDQSTDTSVAVTTKWLKKNEKSFNRIKFFQQESNQGLGKTRNAAFGLTETPFVFVLDADNIIYPKCLEKLLKGIQNTKASFVHSYLEIFHGDQGLLGLHKWDPSRLIFGNTIDAMVLMRKEAWQQVGGYSEDMPSNGWEDFEFWFKLAEAGGYGQRIPEILCRYRVHNQSMLRQETNLNSDALWLYLKSKHPSFFEAAETEMAN